MSRTTDDKIERVQTLTVEGAIGPADADVPPTPRMRRISATVDDAGLNIIDRAVMLYLAKRAIMEPSNPGLYGQALVAFARDYLWQEFNRSSS